MKKESVEVLSGLLKPKSKAPFEELKRAFKNAPLLIHFEFSKPCVLHVDSSKYALSVVLLQADDQGSLHLVFFLFNKWSKKESLWQVNDQKLGAIFQAFIECHAWFINTKEPGIVMSDHANIKYFN